LAASRDPADAVGAIRQFLLGGAFGQAEGLALERGVEVIDAGFSQSLLPLLDPRLWVKVGQTPPPRISLLRGEALFAVGRWAESGKAYQECRSARDPLTAAEARLGQGKAEVQRHALQALPLLLDARDRLEKLGALRLLAEAQYQLGCVYEVRLQFEPAREAYERGRAVAFDLGDRRWEGLCTYGLGRLRSLQWDNAGADELEREALRLLERGGYRLDIAKVCAGLGGNLLELRRWEEAEAYLTRATAEARATGATSVLAACLYNLASIRAKTGNIDAVIPFALEALESYDILEQHGPVARTAAWIAQSYWSRGEDDLGNRYARLGEEHLRRTPEPAQRMRALRHLARAARETKRIAEAREYMTRAISEARKADLPKLVEEITIDIRALPSS
jgi:tetratricopeptide (TPR) repeat protein